MPAFLGSDESRSRQCDSLSDIGFTSWTALNEHKLLLALKRMKELYNVFMVSIADLCVEVMYLIDGKLSLLFN